MRRAGMTTAFVLWAAATLAAQQPPALKDVFHNAFRVGAALNLYHIFGADKRGVAIVTTHFDSITPENVLKWEAVHPEPGTYDFTPADRFVAFGLKHRMFIVGHCLVWHSQTP